MIRFAKVLAIAICAVIVSCGRGYVIPLVAGERAVSIAADGSKSSAELDHAWEFMSGSGHAGLYLRPVWRDRMLSQLADVHDRLGVRTVRFHGIFLDEVGVYRGPGDYDFANVDQIYDSILAAGVKPFIELSFMPRELASCARRGFPLGYRPYICPPRDYDEWGRLIEAFTRHLVERYRLEEVRTWHFEVWNEPNLPVFWGGNQPDYFRLYEVTARAIKSVDPELKVGGPATSAATSPWIYDLIAFCARQGVPLDFISTHGYSNESLAAIKKDAVKAGVSPETDAAAGFYYNEVRLIKRITEGAGRSDLAVYLTEWNSSVAYSYSMNQWPNDHDLPNDAAFMCAAVKQVNGFTDGFSHWTFSDVFEEWGLPGEHWPVKAGAFHGGFGLITYDGIHKPSYHAFSFLHRMGRNRLELEIQSPDSPPGVDAMITLDGDVLSVLAWNYLDTIARRQDSGPAARIALDIVNLPPELRGKRLQGYRIDWEHGNPFAAWLEMGKPGELTPDQVERLKKQSDDTLRDPGLDLVIAGPEIGLDFELPPAGVVFLTTE